MASQTTFEALLQCSICLERFTQPKALPCLHTFCLSCLQGIVENAKTVDCPTCRRPHPVPEQGVVGFPDNLMAISFLSMIGESTGCNDCGKKQILSECEHCQQQVCYDCRVAHNVLQAEISILIESLELGVLKNHDDKIVQAAQTALNNDEQVVVDIHAAFDEVIRVLNERREATLQQVRMVVKIHEAVTQGTSEAVIRDMQHELSICGNKEGLKRMKESLMRVEELLSGELDFTYDVKDVGRFGELRCSEETRNKQETKIISGTLTTERTDAKSRLESRLVAGGDSLIGPVARLRPMVGSVAGGFGASSVIPPGVPNRGLVDKISLPTENLLPTHVDYGAKSAMWKTVIVNPEGCGKFEPKNVVFSPTEDAIYCLSSRSVYVYVLETDEWRGCHKSVVGTHIIARAKGGVWMVDDCHLFKITLDELGDPVCNSYQVLALNSAKAVQIGRYGNEFVVLDSGKKSLVKLDEQGRLVQEMKVNMNELSESSLMCVDREGRIYVSHVRITERKDNEDWVKGCKCSSVSVKVSWEVVIAIMTWDGRGGKWKLVVDQGSKNYKYKFSGSSERCRAGEYHCPRDNDSVPDDLIIREHAIRGLCVDGDGYISVSPAGRNQIDVYDPKHKLCSTIGNEETPEFKEPRGLTLMPDGKLVVCDTGNKRLQII